MKKRFLTCLLALTMLFSLLPVSALATGETIEYDLSSGSLVVSNDSSYTVTSTGTETEHTIIIKAGTCNLTISDLKITAKDAPAIRVENGATLNLTLEGKNTLTGGPGYAGISVAAAWDDEDNYSPDESAHLKIDGEGSLTVTGGDADETAEVGGGAGIGGDGFHETTNPNGADFGVIEIKDGTVTAAGGSTTFYEYGTGAGIGGGAGLSFPFADSMWNYSGRITISGGTVNAKGGDGLGSAGIGGAAQGNGNYSTCTDLNILISGGAIHAEGGAAAAGIGGSCFGDHGKIEISGGTIEAIGAGEDATGANGGAGIGGGTVGGGVEGTSITIGGEAEIVAKGGGAGAGIGGGNGGYSPRIIIEGNANVTAYGGFPPDRTENKRGGAGIGSGNNVNVVTQGERYSTITLNTAGKIVAYGGKGSQAIGLGTCAPDGSDNTKYNHLSVAIGENSGEIWMFNYDNDQSAMYAVDVTGNTVDGAKLTLGDKNALYWWNENSADSSAWYQFGSDSDNTTHTWSADGGTLTVSKGSETVASCGYDTAWHEATDNWAMIQSLPKYTVSFVPGNGETISAQQIVQGGTAKAPTPAPEKSGFVFAGWYTDQAGTSSYDFNTPVTADITLYAKWSVDTSKTYTVTYYVDSNEYNKEEVQGGGTAVAPTPAPEKSGFVFAGWYTDPAVTTPYEFETPVTGHLALYAKFIGIKIEVKIDVKINVDIIGTDVAVVSIGNDQKGALAHNIDFETDVLPDTTLIEIDAIVKYAENEAEVGKITEYLTENKYNCGDNRIDYDVAVQKIIYPTPGTPVPLHELKEPIRIAFAIPNKWKSGGTVSMFRAHTEGGATIVEMLADQDTDAATYTIESDKFSTYTMIYVPKPTGGGGEGGGGGGTTTYYTLRYDSNGGTTYKDERYAKNTVVKLDKVPVREGYQFIGWYADKDLTERITSIKMTSNQTVYAGWHKSTVPDMLNGDDHFAYIVGYVDGTVRPNANISRAEVATIFFRLLKPEIRDDNLTSFSTFADVTEDMWCSKSVATMAKLGIVRGRTRQKPLIPPPPSPAGSSRSSAPGLIPG